MFKAFKRPNSNAVVVINFNHVVKIEESIGATCVLEITTTNDQVIKVEGNLEFFMNGLRNNGLLK